MNAAKKLCIYHGNCADGFGAAWVVRKALGSDIEFHVAHYGGTPPDVAGKHVIIVDFSYPYDTLVELADQAASVLILDHHKTAQEDLKGVFSAGENYEQFNGECKAECLSCNAPHIGQRFDMTRSGAGLTWDFFFPGQPRPALISHIEDRDLWLFKLEGTREIQANLFSYPYDFEVWDGLMAADVQTLRLDGAAIERKHHKDVAELVAATKRRLVIGGHDVPVASLPYTLTSDAGHLMAQGEPFAACYWDTPTGRVFSLRSTDEGMDVSEIASQYGGGGHRNASGFRVSFDHALANPGHHSQAALSEGMVLGELVVAVPGLTRELREILGRPSFLCHGIAISLRALGHDIATRSEDEQAAVIHWMLGHYLRHGSQWRCHAFAELEAGVAPPGGES